MGPRVLVVGGGLSGLVAANSLRERGLDATVLEAGDRAGGLVTTELFPGGEAGGRWLVERGANGFLDNAPATMDLAHGLGLADALVRPREVTVDRYIVHRDHLVRLPSKPQQIITSPLMSPSAKLRLLREPKIPPLVDAEREESIGQFARRRFGPDAMDAVDAFVTGVYGGDPERLSLRHAFPGLARMEAAHGSVLKALRSGKKGEPHPRITAPRDGMQRVTDALAERLGGHVRTGARVTRVAARARGGFTVTLADGSEEHADGVVVALPPNAARDVVDGADWARTREAPMVVAALGYKATDAPGATGFGYLAPESARRFALGAVFESNLFPARAPPGFVLVRVLVGGVRHPDRAGLADDALLARVREDLSALRVTVDDPEPRFVHVARPGAIPQIEIGHGSVLAAAGKAEASAPGLAFTGAGWRSVAVNGLVPDAVAAADRCVTAFARR